MADAAKIWQKLEQLPPDRVAAKIITVLTRYRPIILELIKNCNACNFTRLQFFGIDLKL